jgi:hypothetical protein
MIADATTTASSLFIPSFKSTSKVTVYACELPALQVKSIGTGIGVGLGVGMGVAVGVEVGVGVGDGGVSVGIGVEVASEG